ncbi:hypothetical protein MKQ68_19075 [Chitinophaga horti]|uniref:Uncharacterized protein n=1 Tax=Chitinophaga horti TaxID=2920382 RepID=A0ABY6IXT3_9BACT|nr:hypothetical protein [Chitinophaga horti]UYQ92193.1 hypothetical protein MKQ68_19075 [Chitinophaga horti]
MKVYAIASRINGGDFLVCMENDNSCGPMVYQKIEQVKEFFKPYYDVLPQGSEHPAFASMLEKFAVFFPVIVALDLESAMATIEQEMEVRGIHYGEFTVLPFSHGFFRMKPGFIDRHLELDVLKDIEHIQLVDADGKIRLNQFEIVRSYLGETSKMPPADERALDKVLRERALK